jgi:WD40 repeat protein
MPAYDAFISYSHQADQLTARTLQKGLENFNRMWLGPRPLRIFRDETDLSVAPSLWGVIQEALRSSRFFVLLSSPEAARSKWVAKEIAQWLDTKPKNTILLVITGGTYRWEELRADFDRDGSSAIPPALFGAFSEEPLFLDLRGVELRGHRKAESQSAIATLASPIRGKSKEELLGLEIRLFRRRVTMMVFALGLIAALAAGFLWQGVEARRQRDVARTERNHAQSHLLAAQSTLALQQQQAAPAFWRAAEAWTTDPDWVSQKALYDFARTGLHTTFDHGSDVRYAAMSRDGKYALTSGVGLKVWKTDGTPVFSVNSGLTSGNPADLAPDSTGVLYVLNEIQVFSMSGIKQFDLPKISWDRNAWFSPNSLSLVTVEYGEPILKRYSRDGRLLNQYQAKGEVTCIAVSADSSKIAVGTDRGDLYLWTIGGDTLGVFHEPGRVTSVGFSSTGSKLLSVTREGRVTIRNTDDGARVVLVEQRVVAAAISPGAEKIGVLLDDGTIRLMNSGGQPIRTLEDKNNRVLASRFSSAASIQRDFGSKALKLLSQNGWQGDSEYGAQLRFTRSGRNIVVSVKDITQVWDVQTSRVVKTVMGGLLSVLPESEYLITSGRFAALLWEVDGASRSEIQHESPESSTVPAITAFEPGSADGAIVTASFDGNAKVWDSAGKLTATVTHGSALQWAGFSHDGKMLLTVGRDTTAKLWSRQGSLLRELRHADLINHAAFSSDDQVIVTSSMDGTAVIWGLRGDRLAVLDHKCDVYSAAFSPDGQLVATGASDRAVRVWNRSGTLKWARPTEDSVQKVMFSPDGRQLVAVTTGKVVWVFESVTGRFLSQLKHPEELITAEVAPTGNIVLTSALDRVVRVWDMGGRLLAELSHLEPVTSVAMSRDGRRVLTASDDGLARLWDLSGNELFAFPDEAKIKRAAFSADGESVLTLTPKCVRTWNFGSPESIITHYRWSIGKPLR